MEIKIIVTSQNSVPVHSFFTFSQIFHLQLSTDLPKLTFFIILKIMSLSGFVHQKPNKPNTQVTNRQ